MSAKDDNQHELNKRKKQLLDQRQTKIKKKLLQANKQKLAANKPEKYRVPVHIRSKIIQKKNFKTVHEKIKAPQIVLQDNVNANTFVYKSEKYRRIVEKTTQTLNLSMNKIREACTMLIAYGKDKPQEKNLYVRVSFDDELKCMLRPIQIQIPHPGKGSYSKCILITEYGKRKAEEFQSVKHLNVEIFSLSDFYSKLKDSEFKKVALKPTTKLFCDFKIYDKIENSNIFHQIVSRSVIFPIENGKVPVELRSRFSSYSQYIQDLVNHSYFFTKSLKQQQYMGYLSQIRLCRMRELTATELSQNAMEGIVQIISRLLQKNKMKHRRVEKIEIKSDSSIGIEVYKKP